MTRLVLKLLFKASLPLALLVGTLSYGVYLRGGDPFAVLQRVAGGIGGDGRALAARAGAGVRDAGSALRDAGDGLGDADGLTEVYTWRDANGVTHFSSESPDGIAADIVSIDPDANVLAPVGAGAIDASAGRSVAVEKPAAARPRDAGVSANVAGPTRLPGVAGMLGHAPDDGGVSPEQAERLLELLQGRRAR